MWAGGKWHPPGRAAVQDTREPVRYDLFGVVGGEAFEVVDPGQGGASPILCARDKVQALSQGARTKPEIPGLAVGRRRVDGRAAGRAECLAAPIAAFGNLHIDRWRARQQTKTALDCRNDNAECRAGQDLAIPTVAQLDGRGIDFRLESQRAAKA